MSVQYSGGCSVQWRVYSTVEGVQYSGGCTVAWNILTAVEEYHQYSGGISSVRWKMCNTGEGHHQYYVRYHQYG